MTETTAPVPPTTRPASVREIVLRVGGAAHVVNPLLRQLPLPLMPDALIAYAWANDAIEQAADTRQGVVLVGPGDCGKSTALSHAVRAFEAGELATALHDATYHVRRVVHVRTILATTEDEALVALYAEAFGVPPLPKTQGRRKHVTEVFAETVERLRDEHVAVIVIDDADDLPDPVIQVIEKLMARATDAHPERMGERTISAPGGTIAPQGIGIVIAGTAKLEATITLGDESGNAWKAVRRVGPIEAGAVADVFAQLLPAAAAAQRQMGQTAFARLVHEQLTFGRPMGIGTLDAIVRQYVRRAVITQMDQGRVLTQLTDVPWDTDLLAVARSETLAPKEGRLASPSAHAA
jgi:hypothetical protein